MNFSLTESNNSRSMQVKKAKTKVLIDYVSNVVKKATMLIIVQQSVKGFCLVTRDYIASSVEKMNILLVGLQKKIVINPRIEVSIPLLLVKHTIAKILKQEKHVSIIIKRDISQVSTQEAFWIKWRRILKDCV
jgi:hypothetical protein